MIDNNPQQFLQLLEQMDDSGGFGGSQGIEVNLTYADQQVVNEVRLIFIRTIKSDRRKRIESN